MTFKQKIQEYLKETVYFDEYILSIIDAVIDDERNKEIKNWWNDDINGYPPYMVPIILVGVNAIALEWLKDKMPEHFLIPFFEEKVCGIPIPEAKNE